MRIFTHYSQAVDVLNDGGIVAIPTETVYGLAGIATHQDAVLKIFAAKNRPFLDPLIVHIPRSWLSISELTRRGVIAGDLLAAEDYILVSEFLKTSMPGPLSLLLPKGRKIPDIVTSGSNLVAIRSPEHEVAQELLESLQLPLAAPSANLFGKISPTSLQHVEAGLQGKIDFVLDGGHCKNGIESTIVRINNSKLIIYRKGSFDIYQVANKFSEVLGPSKGEVTPGSQISHYAPDKPVLRWTDGDAFGQHDFLIVLTSEFSNPFIKLKFPGRVICLTSDYQPMDAARNLFSALHSLNLNAECNRIFYLDRRPSGFIWDAIIDRLSRASGNG